MNSKELHAGATRHKLFFCFVLLLLFVFLFWITGYCCKVPLKSHENFGDQER